MSGGTLFTVCEKSGPHRSNISKDQDYDITVLDRVPLKNSTEKRREVVENMLSNPLAIAALGRWNCHNRRYHSVVIGNG
jgi:hypothetical protein